MMRHCVVMPFLLLALCFFQVHPAAASDDEIWWSSAVKEAERDGYKLIDSNDLASLIESDEDIVVVDVRADYEFEAGRIKRSVNLEFDLGDRTDISSEKRAAFETLAGSDKKRQLVIYCRSFR